MNLVLLRAHKNVNPYCVLEQLVWMMPCCNIRSKQLVAYWCHISPSRSRQVEGMMMLAGLVWCSNFSHQLFNSRVREFRQVEAACCCGSFERISAGRNAGRNTFSLGPRCMQSQGRIRLSAGHAGRSKRKKKK